MQLDISERLTRHIKDARQHHRYFLGHLASRLPRQYRARLLYCITWRAADGAEGESWEPLQHLRHLRRLRQYNAAHDVCV
ncbi:hypothetical protein OEZ85_000764 [Tetradesmus obliquus]|uniref:Chromo domain-containing protein n=1 Tax=Tetradesmus obliquus TaxID=3088 RepID=A0ABY8UMR1_TETOB|nr:hypothetical protein OEZ85_000764 [Tetradesmus obliquus]